MDGDAQDARSRATGEEVERSAPRGAAAEELEDR